MFLEIYEKGKNNEPKMNIFENYQEITAFYKKLELIKDPNIDYIKLYLPFKKLEFL